MNIHNNNKIRREIGIDRQLCTDRVSPPNPALGGTRGYPVRDRQRMMQNYANGGPMECSLRSIKSVTTLDGSLRNM